MAADYNPTDINVLALTRGHDKYIFFYEDSQHTEVLRALSRFASNPDLNFTWYDAAVLTQRVSNAALAASRAKEGST